MSRISAKSRCRMKVCMQTLAHVDVHGQLMLNKFIVNSWCLKILLAVDLPAAGRAFLQLMSTVLLIAVGAPFALPALVMMMGLFWMLYGYYIASMRQAKRLEAVSRWVGGCGGGGQQQGHQQPGFFPLSSSLLTGCLLLHGIQLAMQLYNCTVAAAARTVQQFPAMLNCCCCRQGGVQHKSRSRR